MRSRIMCFPHPSFIEKQIQNVQRLLRFGFLKCSVWTRNISCVFSKSRFQISSASSGRYLKSCISQIIKNSSINQRIKSGYTSNFSQRNWRYLRRFETYLVCPMRCTRPTACNSWAGFKAGSTNNTCVASMMFRPLEPVCRGRRSTPTRESCLNVCRFDWGEENSHYNWNFNQGHLLLWGGGDRGEYFVWPDTHLCFADTHFDIWLYLTGHNLTCLVVQRQPLAEKQSSQGTVSWRAESSN